MLGGEYMGGGISRSRALGNRAPGIAAMRSSIVPVTLVPGTVVLGVVGDTDPSGVEGSTRSERSDTASSPSELAASLTADRRRYHGALRKESRLAGLEL